MTPDERRLLEETAELAEENNKLLKKLHRAAIWSRAFRVVYWAVILIAGFGAYYFIQPYIEALQSTYEGIRGGVQSVQEIQAGLPGLEDLLPF